MKKTEKQKEEKKLILNEIRVADLLLNKGKKWFSEYIYCPAFKEPIVLLIRNTGEIDIYEDVKKEEWIFDHSDGTKRTITLTGKPHKLKHHKGYVLTYLCNEDMPFPILDSLDPVITITEHSNVIIKTQDAISRIKAQNLKAKGELWISIAKGLGIIIAVLGGILILGGLVGITFPWEVVAEPVKQVINTIPPPTII